VFAGLRKVLEQNRNAVIVFEFSPQYIKNFGLDPREFLSSLSAQGYELSVIDDKHHRTASKSFSTVPARWTPSSQRVD
jgi:poly-D-alanine transfer protein DltD